MSLLISFSSSYLYCTRWTCSIKKISFSGHISCTMWCKCFLRNFPAEKGCLLWHM